MPSFFGIAYALLSHAGSLAKHSKIMDWYMGCLPCVRRCAEKEECVYATLGQCKSAARVLNVVKADTLGVDDEERHGKGRHYGLKLEKVISLVK